MAGAQDDYVDGPIAEGVSEGPDPTRPLAVTDPAGAGSSEATVVANLGYIVSHMLETAMR